MGRIAPGKATLDAGVATVGLAVLVGDHAHDLIAAHLRLEGAADSAIGAGGHDRMLRLADLDDRLLRQRRGRAGLYAGAAGHAFGAEERFFHAGRHDGVEATPRNRQREGALHLLTRAHTARADYAFRRVVGEIRIGLVFARVGMLVAGVAVAHVAQADCARHVLQFAVPIRCAGQTVERMVGDVELHHALAQALESLRLRAHAHTRRDRRRAGRGRAGAAVDLDQTQPAGAERVEHVGRAQLRDLRSDFHGGTHDRRALGHRHRHAVYRQGHSLLGPGARRAVIDLVYERHDGLLTPPPRADAGEHENPRGNG